MAFRIPQNRFGARVFVPFVALALPVPASAGFIEFSGQSAPTQGTGLGATHHILELDDLANDLDDVESGAITWNGATDVATTAEVKVPHSNTETFGSLLGLGLEAAAAAAGVNGFSVLFDVNEPGGGLATLQALSLIFYPENSGVPLWTFEYTGPDLALGDDGGVGQAGWDFEVRFTDAEWDFFTDPANANYRVGMSATIATVAGAPENFFVAPAAVPEPSSWALLGLVGGAGAIGRFVRRRKAKRDAI